jgi:hypothetical protein
MMFFESLGLLMMGLIIIKFTRLSRKLSLFYRILERPLPQIIFLLIFLGFVFCLLSFAAMHIWGVHNSEFRRLNKSLYILFTIFTLHSDQIFDVIAGLHPLYRFNEWWTFFILLIYTIILQYTFMNQLTATFFEEHRIATLYEETIARKYRHLNEKSNSMWTYWVKGLIVCFKKKDAAGKELPDEDAPPDLSAVNDLKEKTRL